MSITISGVASGLDTDGIINQLMSLEQRPIQLLQNKIARHTQRLGAVTALGSNVGAVGAGAKRVTDDLFDKSKISVGDSTILDVTDNGGAAPGTYAIEVKQLAKAHRIASAGFADKDTTSVAAEAGTFAWKVGVNGDVKSVSVAASTTLQDLADRINGLSDAGVHASIISDATATNPHRLVITSATTGTASDVTITTNDTTLDLADKQIDVAEVGVANSGTYTGEVESSGEYTGSGNKTYLLEVMTEGEPNDATYRYSTDGGITWNYQDEEADPPVGFTLPENAGAIGDNEEGVSIQFESTGESLSVGDRFSVDVFDPQLQASRNAVTVVDGITAVTQTNTVTDVIGGTSINLAKAEAGTTVNVTIAKDFETLSGEVNGMVVSLNGLSSFVNDQSKYDVETNRSGILSGDAAVRGMYRTLRSTLMAPSAALQGTKYDSLVAIGLSVDRDGAFSLDSAKLSAALEEDASAVQKLLKDYGATSTSKIQYQSQSLDTVAGRYDVEVIDDGAGGNTLTIGGHSVTLIDDVATGAIGTPIEGLVIKVDKLQEEAQGVLGTLTLSKGILDNVGRSVDTMIDADTGIIKGKTDAINQQVKSLNEQIVGHERRIGLVEARLRRQFTDLEILMGQLQAQQDFITQQIAQFNKDK